MCATVFTFCQQTIVVEKCAVCGSKGSLLNHVQPWTLTQLGNNTVTLQQGLCCVHCMGGTFNYLRFLQQQLQPDQYRKTLQSVPRRLSRMRKLANLGQPVQ